MSANATGPVPILMANKKQFAVNHLLNKISDTSQ